MPRAQRDRRNSCRPAAVDLSRCEFAGIHETGRGGRAMSGRHAAGRFAERCVADCGELAVDNAIASAILPRCAPYSLSDPSYHLPTERWQSRG